MKKVTYVLALLLVIGTASAQTDVYFKINHFLGSNPFAFNTSASNNMGNTFNVKRLQYYIAEIKIVHDGGQITDVPNKWILVNANSTVNEMLGNFNITSIEAVKFGIGVQLSHNHLDPSTYPSTHPLAPKSPSMHWGWSAGYRFLAFEGKQGPSLNQTFEFHSLGDGNYHTFTIATAGKMVGNDLEIELNADYEKALYNIDLSTGNNIVHGETGKAADILVNFSYEVFTSSEGNGSIGLDEDDPNPFRMYPNPSNGIFTIEGVEAGQRIVVYNAIGTVVLDRVYNENDQDEINLDNAGVYVVQVLENENVVETERIVIVK